MFHSHIHMQANMSFLSLPIPLPSSPTFFQKPPTPHAFIVSCNAGRDNVDRRDLLLGMGSLYGATNLVIPGALATPITTVQKCDEASYTNRKTNENFEVECCPKASDEVVVYTFPEFKDLRVRPAAHRVSKKYIDKYKMAIAEMKKLPPEDPRSFISQANVHCAYCNNAYSMPSSDPEKKNKLQIHFSWFFFPWHRWYLYFYERILADLIHDDTFALPFWNWDNPTGMQIPPMFVEKDSILSEARRNLDHYPQPGRFNPVDLAFSGTDKAINGSEIVAGNISNMHSEMISGSKNLVDFYGEKYAVGINPSPGAGAVERGSHTAVHRWCGDPGAPVGEDMGNFYSAGKDPLFYSHHANVDRLWTVWRGIRRSKGKETDFTDCDWLESTFLFYDEKSRLVQVKVGDSLDAGKMGYTNETMELPWLKEKPKARKKRTKVAFTSKAPNATDPGVFPVTLDKVVRVLVDRPKQRRSKEDKENVEELLVVEGIDVDATKFVRFEVFVNDEDDVPSDIRKQAEYAGAYSQVPHKSGGSVKSRIRLGLTELLEELDVEDDDKILVSLVPRAGGKDITIDGVKIVFV